MILVTGATGYIGGRLVPRLLESGYPVRVLVRDASRLLGRPWLDDVQLVQGDVLKPNTLPRALGDVSTVYYLIRGFNSDRARDSSAFYERDSTAARNLGQAAKTAGVERIVYLGSLGSPEATSSDQLRSKHRTGEALRASGIPVTEFRAAPVIGCGSLTYEIIHYMTERLPIMICPHWLYTRVQPIATCNVLEYLVAASRKPETNGKIIEIGGQDILTYADMIRQYAGVRGLRRVLVPVPMLSPRLSAYWIHWASPVPAGIARSHIATLQNEAIVLDDKARRLFPEIKPIDYKTTVRRSLNMVQAGNVETAWFDALATSQGDTQPMLLTTHEGMLIERRRRLVNAPASVVHRTYTGLGGDRGWPYYNWAWRARGLIDRLVGGVGLRRGRRDPDDLRVGDALDFWRVEAVEPNRLLRLRAEMKVPGRAWLQYEAIPTANSKTRLIQTAFFASTGLFGLLYWYVLYPIHGLIFSGTIRKLAEQAEAMAEQTEGLSRQKASAD